MSRRTSQFKPLLDAGGARRRAQQAEAYDHEVRKLREEDRKRVTRAAGRIPVLSSISAVVEHATEVANTMSRSRHLSFPVLQFTKKLDLNEVFAALPQNYGNVPNVVAERTGQPGVGAHFDDYYGRFSPWAVHENLEGAGHIRATFLPSAQFAAYLGLKESLPKDEETEFMLAQTRASIGNIALAHSTNVYEGDISAGTRTIIWHGSRRLRSLGIPPAVHDIERTEPGAYRIFAHQQNGELGAGFTTIAR